MAEALVLDPEAAAARRRRLGGLVAVYGLLGLFSLVYLLPLFVVIFNSFRPLPEILQNGLIAFPRSIGFSAWGDAWSSYCINGLCEGMRGNFVNSLKMAIPATIISTLLGAVNGYVLSKWRFPGSETLFTIMLFGVFMPGQVALMPWAYVLGATGLSNTTAGLVLIHTVQGISFTTLFCRNYYVNIPDDLIKAARIDGAGFWRIFRKIVLPLSPPILIVTVIWQFTGIWNEFLFGVVFTSGKAQPITAALVALASDQTNVRNYDVMSAGVLIGALPPLLIYFFGGKYFVRGLTQGAVK
ncbi:carbohydrate ABC transporter permease [Amaricoccus sp.]|uniref:carbohydrate ABC transporter permease n=1 Tax=Amaricoccus sp. TaxID=1872485 RepID=UPI001B55BAFF|nr:carbohydrate ABC transporter permease [Amaricoccus sp.]MBP7000881.1 carbohydrate ABC transporter permease [Amaricoccus sp.]